MKKNGFIAEHFVRLEPHDWILGMQEIVKITGLSKASIYTQMKRGSFPMASKIGQRRIGWRASQINIWMEERFGPG